MRLSCFARVAFSLFLSPLPNAMQHAPCWSQVVLRTCLRHFNGPGSLASGRRLLFLTPAHAPPSLPDSETVVSLSSNRLAFVLPSCSANPLSLWSGSPSRTAAPRSRWIRLGSSDFFRHCATASQSSAREKLPTDCEHSSEQQVSYQPLPRILGLCFSQIFFCGSLAFCLSSRVLLQSASMNSDALA
ncbi:hypothetical protein cyc_06967 [Cyclospora cayetanensis]|uniref:Transmembrane protein n=1 Tax=Cyclospora cayetanensis TaxID=88456 RepID=A0A1D3D807_9EIME|nr:hypothetical protein cyc_06967 [Cyclospora cayetanensis]